MKQPRLYAFSDPQKRLLPAAVEYNAIQQNDNATKWTIRQMAEKNKLPKEVLGRAISYEAKPNGKMQQSRGRGCKTKLTEDHGQVMAQSILRVDAVNRRTVAIHFAWLKYL